jgi:hypothetical protein
MNAKTEGLKPIAKTRGGRRRNADDEPLAWWRRRAPDTITPFDSVQLWTRVQEGCAAAGLPNAASLETQKLVFLALEGANPHRDLIMSWLFLRAIEGHKGAAGAAVVIANCLRREGVICSELADVWMSALVAGPPGAPA